MTLATIRKGFETRLKAWADALTPAMPIAWQNKAFTPPTGRYARAYVLPAQTESRHLSRLDRSYTGIFQVNLCMTLDTGAGAVESLIAQLDAAFGHTFTEGDVKVWLTAPFSPAPPLQADDRFIIPVSAPYEANVPGTAHPATGALASASSTIAGSASQT